VEIREGYVQACFNCEPRFEGYSGYIHGGIVSSVLDGAMTNCLFAQGHPALTAELNVRFHHPLMIEKPAIVTAWVEHHNGRYHFLRAEITQDSLVKARGWAKFLDSP
jgi:acyl-coenzyme A thioesterase PaaI-like protein